MAGLGAKKFAANSLLSSTDVNGYLAEQVIMKFANAAARDAAFGGAGEPTLAEGMFCYLDDTNVLQSYTGSAWVTLTSSINPPALELVSGVTVTSVGGTSATASNGVVAIGTSNTSVIVANAFSSTYDNYLIQISNTVVSANQPNLGIQMTGTTSGYNYAGLYNGYSVSTVTGDATFTATYFNIGACGNGTTGAGRISMDVQVKSPNLPQATFFNASNASLSWNSVYNGMLNNTTQYTGFTIMLSSGSITGGTIRVYGYRNQL